LKEEDAPSQNCYFGSGLILDNGQQDIGSMINQSGAMDYLREQLSINE